MVWLKRVGLFLLVNVMVMVTISITFNVITQVFGIQLPVGYSGLLMMCAVFGFSGSFISLMMSKFMAKRMMGVQIIDPSTRDPELRWIVDTTHAMARKANLPKMPEVGIFDSPEINAFATGPSKSNSLVAVSSGLMRAMTKDEAEGVIGHEVAHIANGDMVTLTLIQGVVNTFVMFLARVLAGIIANQGSDRDGESQGSHGGPMYFILVMVFDIAFAVLASIIVNYFSRLREYRADAGGARFAGRDKMLSGLQKLQAQYKLIEPDNGAAATMKISSKSSGLMKLFSTHPPLEERIKRLQQMRMSAV